MLAQFGYLGKPTKSEARGMSINCLYGSDKANLGALAFGVAMTCLSIQAQAQEVASERPDVKVAAFSNESNVTLRSRAKTGVLHLGERMGAWTFMGIVQGAHRYAVLEDFQKWDGHLLLVDEKGIQVDLPK